MDHELRFAVLCLAAAGLCSVLVYAARPRDSHSPGLTAGAGRAGSGLAASLPDPATPAPVSPELHFIRDYAALMYGVREPVSSSPARGDVLAVTGLPVVPSLAPPGAPPVDSLAALIDRLILVESGGDPFAVGDGGTAWGVLQIRPVMVAECNRIGAIVGGRVDWTHDDAWDEAASREMCRVYSVWWADRRDDWSDEGIARRWNGGPRGHQKESTVGYWRKVSRVH